MAKGMRKVLEERQLWRDGLLKECPKRQHTSDHCCAVNILSSQPDFANQKTLLEEIVTAAGHQIIFYPKFHCEFNFIEQFWGAAKLYTRRNSDYTWEGLKKT